MSNFCDLIFGAHGGLPPHGDYFAMGFGGTCKFNNKGYIYIDMLVKNGAPGVKKDLLGSITNIKYEFKPYRVSYSPKKLHISFI